MLKRWLYLSITGVIILAGSIVAWYYGEYINKTIFFPALSIIFTLLSTILSFLIAWYTFLNRRELEIFKFKVMNKIISEDIGKKNLKSFAQEIRDAIYMKIKNMLAQEIEKNLCDNLYSTLIALEPLNSSVKKISEKGNLKKFARERTILINYLNNDDTKNSLDNLMELFISHEYEELLK